MALHFDHVAALSDFEVDGITELRAFGNDDETMTALAHDVVSSVRDAVIEANDGDRWDERNRGALIHELADDLVPIGTFRLMRELAVIGYAWHVDFGDDETSYVGYDFGNHSYGDTPSAVADIAARALYFAYRHALELLVEWAEENAPDDDESGDDDDSIGDE